MDCWSAAGQIQLLMDSFVLCLLLRWRQLRFSWKADKVMA